MAVLPTDIFEEYSLETVDGAQGVFIPLTSLPGLSATEANATTGDGREVLRVLTNTAFENISALPTFPSKIGFTYTDVNVSEGKKRQDFTLSFAVTVPTSAYVMENE